MRDNLTLNNAHENEHQSAHSPSRTLAYPAPCRYCAASIYLALCSDGKWRSFDHDDTPAAPLGVWAWRRHQGMQEQELVPGKRLHYCAEYAQARPWETLP